MGNGRGHAGLRASEKRMGIEALEARGRANDLQEQAKKLLAKSDDLKASQLARERGFGRDSWRHENPARSRRQNT